MNTTPKDALTSDTSRDDEHGVWTSPGGRRYLELGEDGHDVSGLLWPHLICLECGLVTMYAGMHDRAHEEAHSLTRLADLVEELVAVVRAGLAARS